MRLLCVCLFFCFRNRRFPSTDVFFTLCWNRKPILKSSRLWYFAHHGPGYVLDQFLLGGTLTEAPSLLFDLPQVDAEGVRILLRARVGSIYGLRPIPIIIYWFSIRMGLKGVGIDGRRICEHNRHLRIPTPRPGRLRRMDFSKRRAVARRRVLEHLLLRGILPEAPSLLCRCRKCANDKPLNGPPRPLPACMGMMFGTRVQPSPMSSKKSDDFRKMDPCKSKVILKQFWN